MSLVSQIATGAAVALVALVVYTVLQALWYYLQGLSPDRAFGRSTGRTVGLISAALSIAAMGFLQFGGAIDVITQVIANAPLAATNLVTIGLGVIGISTGRVGVVTFVAAAVTWLVVAKLLQEVRA